LEEKAVRSSMCNSMVLCTLFLSDPDQLVQSKLIVCATHFWDSWHSQQNIELRSTQRSFKWMGEQVSGAYLKTLGDTLGLLGSAAAITEIGFQHTFTTLDAAAFGVDHPAVVRDDAYADHFGMLILHLSSLRLCWGCWFLRGWPARSVQMLPGDFHYVQALPALHKDHAVFQKMEDMRGKGSEVVNQVVDRNIFHLTSVKQLLDVTNSATCISEDASEWISRGHHRLIATQVIEDGNKRQRRREQNLTAKRSREAEEYRQLIQKRVLSDVHHFDEVKPHSHKLGSGLSLPPKAFNPLGQKASVDCRSVESFKATTTWYSPKAENHCCFL
jgi:hypothetical protein